MLTKKNSFHLCFENLKAFQEFGFSLKGFIEPNPSGAKNSVVSRSFLTHTGSCSLVLVALCRLERCESIQYKHTVKLNKSK